MKGRLHTRYAPVRRSLAPKNYTPRLACVKPAASVHPEPGSNSSSYILILYNRCFIYRFFSNLAILLLLYFCLVVKRDGCQFNMSTNVSFFLSSLVSQSGCKTKTSFCFLQEKFKVFFENFFIPISLFFLPVFQGTFRVLRGANVKSIFKSHKLF